MGIMESQRKDCKEQTCQAKVSSATEAVLEQEDSGSGVLGMGNKCSNTEVLLQLRNSKLGDQKLCLSHCNGLYKPLAQYQEPSQFPDSSHWSKDRLGPPEEAPGDTVTRTDCKVHPNASRGTIAICSVNLHWLWFDILLFLWLEQLRIINVVFVFPAPPGLLCCSLKPEIYEVLV